jgi:hypothetical protein
MTVPIRIWRISEMAYGPQDLVSGVAAATDQKLALIAASGLTGIWASTCLRDVSRTNVCGELSDQVEPNQAALITLVERCARHGLKLYLYLNEPRGFASDDPFWQEHPELRGAAGSSVMDGWESSCALCTSVPTTLQLLEESCVDLCTAAPDLGGVVLITASEHHTHCYSHFEVRPAGIGAHQGQKEGDVLSCPRCRQRHPRDVVIEVLAAIERGIHKTAPQAHVIAWTWSWEMYDPAPQQQLIEQLPAGIDIMSDFERGGELIDQGQRLPVDEYSLIMTGPSDRCRAQLDLARNAGRRPIVRHQTNTTVELTTCPNFPLVANLYRKLRAIHETRAAGAMSSWNFGAKLDTVNFAALGRFYADPDQADEATFLSDLACDYFDLDQGRAVAAVWQQFAEAVKPYPFTFGFLYFGPFNCALNYPLPNDEQRDRPMKLWCFSTPFEMGDRLEESHAPLTLAQMLDRLERMQVAWHAASADYSAALATARQRQRARAEHNVARYFEHLLVSTWVIFSWLAWRYHPEVEPCITRAEMARRLELELANLAAAGDLLTSDRRFGYYEETQTFVNHPRDIAAKRVAVQALRDAL